MRATKLFAIKVNNIDEANDLKEKLSMINIEEIENGVDISYSGFITCDIEELGDDETELTIFTFLELEEFEKTVYECCHTPIFFRYEKTQIL